LVFKGKAKTTAGSGLIDTDVEIKILLPDHFLRTDSAAFGRRLTGYAGRTVLSAIYEGDKTSMPPDALKGGILRAERERLARLLLGAATYVSADIPMMFHSVGGPVEMVDPRSVAGRPTVKVDVSRPEALTVDVTGDRGFAARVVFDG